MNTFMSKIIILILAVGLGLSSSLCGGEESRYVFVPDDSTPFEDLCRIIIYKDGSVKCHKMFFGCVREVGVDLKLIDGKIEFTNRDDSKYYISKDGDVLRKTIKIDGKDVIIVFKENSEWDEKINKAPPIPVTRKQAIETLDMILSTEDKDKLKAMKFDDLIKLHHGFGTGLRNGFALWAKDSPIVKEYGGGHPDDVSMKIIEEYWNRLQKK